MAKREAGKGFTDTLVIEKNGYLDFSEPVTVESDTIMDFILRPYVVWPLSRSPELNADADNIFFPYGPRYIGRYDFHAGVDFYGKPRGAPIYTIMDGTVLKVFTASSVLIRHADSLFSAYLHLEETKVGVGDEVSAGDLIGTMGNTNAQDVHLHLTFMTNLTTSTNETKSRNPLEILPYRDAPLPSASFQSDTAIIRMSNELMTARWVTLMSGEVSRTLDYYEIVKLGSTPRDNQTQNDLHIRCGRPSNNRFDLYLSFAHETLTPDRVIVKDFNNTVTLDEKRE
jgi:murein DD-endopeptidase MepM/ murein hydrolase activator NlpD